MKKILTVMLIVFLCTQCKQEYNVSNLRRIYQHMPEKQLKELQVKLKDDSISSMYIRMELNKRNKKGFR